jgi:hypothetical protein
MDSEARAFEVPFPPIPSGVPLRCPRPMPTQQIALLTPWRMLGVALSNLMGTLLVVPRVAMLVPVMLAKRARRA